MNKEHLTNWPCEKVMQHFHHYLHQNSNIAMGYIKVLLDEKAFGFVNDEQMTMLEELQENIIEIQKNTDLLREWLKLQQSQ